MPTNPTDTIFEQIVRFVRARFPDRHPVPLHEPVFSGNEKKYLLDAVDSTYVSSIGEYVTRAEKMLCEISGTRFAVATVNGTAALHMALMVAGVKPGDEVITQAVSFVATPNSISYCGATPVFVDIDKTNLGISPEKLFEFLREKTCLRRGTCLNKATGKRVAACVAVHTFGHPSRIGRILEICDEYGISVIEDATEALGSRYKGASAGAFGRLGVFSFNGNKIVTSGGGGAIVTNDETLGEKAKHLTTTAKIPHPYAYSHDRVGYNYRMPNLNAALVCAQLEKLEEFVEKKRHLAESYEAFFNKLNIPFIKEPADARSNYWLNAILLPNKSERDRFLEFTNSAGICTRPLWKPLNRLPMYQTCQCDGLEHTSWIEKRLVNLPSSVVP
jgi:perosamine synthetase